jgi:hypothetical protein
VAWLHRKKTAEFIAASLEAGAVLADARARTCARLKQAGLALGELFQITDDLLDETQEQGRSRLTAPAVHGREQARGRARRRAAAAERALAGLGREYALLAALPELILGRST